MLSAAKHLRREASGATQILRCAQDDRGSALESLLDGYITAGRADIEEREWRLPYTSAGLAARPLISILHIDRKKVVAMN